MSESAEPHNELTPVARAKLTTAGRLLRAVTGDGSVPIETFARQLGVPASHLAECREGARKLELEGQVVLAAAVLALAPQHARLARQLHAQAQSALRVRNGAVEGHTSYTPVNMFGKLR